MLKKRRKLLAGSIFRVFLVCMVLIITIFLYRAVTHSIVTPLSDGQVILSSKDYTFGAIYDRNGERIVSGSSGEIVWKDEKTEAGFSGILGLDIEETLNSRFTVCGNCPWLYGTEDNRFTLYSLLHPGEERTGGSVRLTIDSNLQKYICQLEQEYGYEHAYVVVSNYHTGELLAVCGNVFQDSMHPGSSIKPILAATALTLEPGIADYIYDCNTGNHSFATTDGPVRINCAGGELHGSMDMTDALAYSCNGYFISLMQQVEKDEMLNALKVWGFDTSISYSQFMYWDHSFLRGSTEDMDYLLASIGQSNCYITPAGLHFSTNAILNHGNLMEPIWFTEKRTSLQSEWIAVDGSRSVRNFCEEEAADQVAAMMLEVTAKGTGRSFYLPDFAAKTGTAQKADENGELTGLHTVWTTGGLLNEETPYSITVCLDEVSGEVGSAAAGRLASRILKYMTEGEE